MYLLEFWGEYYDSLRNCYTCIHHKTYVGNRCLYFKIIRFLSVVSSSSTQASQGRGGRGPGEVA